MEVVKVMLQMRCDGYLENREPLGYAFVAITLDNSDHSLAIDFDEVTVSRRIFRSGESEYMINGAVCRLKDVNELFYDTGIGKFKRRKVMTQKKLDEERSNLVRVYDILSELEKQVKPLEKQSEKAREYLKLKEDLKIRDVNAFLMESDEIRISLKECE